MSSKTAQHYHVLMGDVTGSSKLPGPAITDSLRQETDAMNTRFAAQILSPLTVTLGDEFQGVIASATGTLKLIFDMEIGVLSGSLPDLHYAWVFGGIDTEINPKIAHGMLGPALTQARKNLTRKDRKRPKMQVDLGHAPTTTILNNCLFAMASISERWNEKDRQLILDLLSGMDVKQVAELHDRDTSSIYRRRDTLMIDPYLALKDAALACAAQFDDRPAR